MLFVTRHWLSAVPIQAIFGDILMLAMPLALCRLEFFLNLSEFGFSRLENDDNHTSFLAVRLK